MHEENRPYPDLLLVALSFRAVPHDRVYVKLQIIEENLRARMRGACRGCKRGNAGTTLTELG
jgi:hypothetical protein